MPRITVAILKTQDKDLGVLLRIGPRDGSTVIFLNVQRVCNHNHPRLSNTALKQMQLSCQNNNTS